jgi:hypothetical protein
VALREAEVLSADGATDDLLAHDAGAGIEVGTICFMLSVALSSLTIEGELLRGCHRAA